jgi:hypothetical protein
MHAYGTHTHAPLLTHHTCTPLHIRPDHACNAAAVNNSQQVTAAMQASQPHCVAYQAGLVSLLQSTSLLI